MANKNIPPVSADTILHGKDTDLTERLIFPVTRYSNIINAPQIFDDIRYIYNAPFGYLQSGSEELTYEQIQDFCGPII